MSIGYTIDPDRRLVFIRAWDILRLEHLTGLATALRQDSKFQSDFQAVADLRPVTKVAITASQVSAGLPSAFAPSARRAVIAVPSEAFGMARMYDLTSHLPERTIQLFPELPLAFAWLGLDPDFPWPPTFPTVAIGTD